MLGMLYMKSKSDQGELEALLEQLKLESDSFEALTYVVSPDRPQCFRHIEESVELVKKILAVLGKDETFLAQKGFRNLREVCSNASSIREMNSTQLLSLWGSISDFWHLQQRARYHRTYQFSLGIVSSIIALSVVALCLGIIGPLYFREILLRLRFSSNQTFEIVEWNQEWGTLEQNRSVVGNPIRLMGATYSSGLGTHANSSITIKLLKNGSHFSGICGIDGEVGTAGSIECSIEAAGRVLFSSGILSNGLAMPFRIPIFNTESLILKISNGGDSISSDHADWADLRVED